MNTNSDRGEVIYALDPEQIRVNDIVLISSTELGSWVVRTGTLSDFGHAALCTRLGMLFEAVPTGVMRRSVIGTYATRREWLKVLRPRRATGPNSKGLEVAHYAERMYGRAYSTTRAAASVIPFLQIVDNGSTFCSRVIAEAFRDYGIELLPGRDPSKVYPKKLLESPELCDVTEKSIRIIGSKSDPHLFEEVIEAAEQELPAAEMQMNRRVFTAIRRNLGQKLPNDVVSLPGLWGWLATRQEQIDDVDTIILELLRREGFIEWYENWHQDVQDSAQLFENFVRLAEREPSGPMTPDLQEVIEQLRETAELGKTSLQGRKETMEQFALMAEKKQLLTLNHLREQYHREYELFARLNRARDRLIQALVSIGDQNS